MNKEPTVDKIYLALELTRLVMPYTLDKTMDKNSATLNTFNYFVNELTGVEDIPKINYLEEELDKYKMLYNELNSSIDLKALEKSSNMINKLKQVIQETSGDMEPYVKETLLNIIKNYS